ncbi:IpaD/SipD/SspD family type III secretion system needle tip protein [Rouxiella badensis]|jgi:invasin D|uniref:IpaD/SipD/SspD family type III secretion system needle tip protein n=1 Tax=Rouxiella badensis TaxID=1646377 RepID=A0A1X0WGJ4_9GAMM|nr:IpaD/SipD/SspD family type III secretion system needle tip protein [Rouxiella badensis]MCC3701535.1 IpaD/SipD/SspD family type III secretion system needle tip protein [Rouxiella badensis]ORJ25895.1 hypothetical protein BS640_08375 [Rouxiella badensis]QOI54564.1 IpaD/SipD/SspD family type III secretion system needle tip protein [Rouxiella badensis subsp. acadiensis]WAT04343.1 IpaD/SipD/SspD family type III secretion system needle tip protein [Rouxiella badensis]WAT10881.1 IpaD/SipD/SspD fami
MTTSIGLQLSTSSVRYDAQQAPVLPNPKALWVDTEENVNSSVTEKNSELVQSLNAFEKALLAKDKSDAPFMTQLMLKNLREYESKLTLVKAQDNLVFVAEFKNLKQQMQDKLSVKSSAVAYLSDNDSNISDQIGEIIGEVKEGYYDIFEGALAKYINFYKELSNIMSEMGKLIKKSDKEGYLKYDFKTLQGKLDNLYDKYNKKADDGYKLSQLYPKDPKDNVSKVEAEKWAKDMGLPSGSVLQSQYGGDWYYVAIDLTPLKQMKDNLISSTSNDYELLNTQYESWVTGFNAQEDQIKTTLQSLTGRFANANSVYDNMVKVLSSTIGTLAEMSRRYFSI